MAIVHLSRDRRQHWAREGRREATMDDQSPPDQPPGSSLSGGSDCWFGCIVLACVGAMLLCFALIAFSRYEIRYPFH